ncbi:hypothetical protein LSTR_LSTR003967 [Laodelphax striatellus]|uniref:Regulatory protein zeste n=1 Tax=Laodelphax striatellus TaxID=195883 RepID=A0A482WF24_LAOST|nr:hypothetical protein LSTR_LSTR003967 [Laodelphax striatellus]
MGSLLQKHKAWKLITEEYNKIQKTGRRDTKALSSLYKNLTSRARKQREESTKSGKPMSEVFMKLLRELGEFVPQNKFHCDSSAEVFEHDPAKRNSVEFVLEDTAESERSWVEEQPSNDFSKELVMEEETPRPLTAERPLVADSRKRKPSEQNIVLENYCKGKVDVSKKKLEFIRIEHEKRMEILNLEEEAAVKNSRILSVKEETANLKLEKEKMELEILKAKLIRENLL